MSQTTKAERSWFAEVRHLLNALISLALLCFGGGYAFAQSASAGLTGSVVDSSGALIAGATVTATHEATSTTRQVRSSSDGSFNMTTLAPGRYVVVASHAGFRSTELRGIVLNVDDRLTLRLVLEVAGAREEVTVVSDAPRINTSPSVSTVIDRKFVENLPLNGRSFQALLQLAPGVVLTPANTSQEGGQFSVNGQRTSDNYFTVDGVSANSAASISSGGYPGAAASGQLPTLTTLGGTNGLVSVEALQEFRLQTSSYAPEFGRAPGGQISLVTRSGTNQFHGSAFETYRDESLDATDWFVNRSGDKKAPLDQHNFGGVLGAPIRRDRTFVFGSYEGLRLLLPQAKTVTVPNMETRRTAAAAVQPLLNTMPEPNGRDLGNGFADFLGIYSDPSRLHSTSVRVDHNANAVLKFFGRVSDSRSSSQTRGGSLGYANRVNIHSRGGTVGSTWVISDRMVHDFRANATFTNAPIAAFQTPIGGATLLPTDTLPSGRDPAVTSMAVTIVGGGNTSWGPSLDFPERQVNLVDSLTRTMRSHEFKLGIDFRWTTSTARGGGGSEIYIFEPAGLRTGITRQVALTFRDPSDRTVAFNNLSLYVQDHWRATSRSAVSYGVRWDVLPPPSTISGVDAVTLNRTDDLYDGQVGLASRGTPLWTTRYSNFAPRLGGSYVVRDDTARSLVVKGGIGMFYGLGYGQVANGYGTAYPFTVARIPTAVPYPPASSLFIPPAFGVEPPTQLWVMDSDIRQPYTIQWNVSADQGLGRSRTISVSYIGADGHQLLKVDRYQLKLVDWPNTTVPVQVSRNVGYSDYRSLQMLFRQQLRGGAQAMASYTLSRSRDTGSSDSFTSVPAERLPPALDYGYSNFDVRHMFSAALTYLTPEPGGPKFWRIAARDWGVDVMVRARTGYPVEISTNIPFPPDTQAVRPNIVPGESFWINDRSAAGGRRLNRQAFTIPPPQTQGDLPRGTIRGFGLQQVDLAFRRELPFLKATRLQLRFEAFNLFNTPNFADPLGQLTAASFGVSGQMLGRGLGGQNALYQVGGPRSLQVAVKVQF